MQNSFSFEDAFRKIVQVNDDLLAGRIDVQTAAVHHAGSVALDKLLNTAIKVRLSEMASGKELPLLGKTEIYGPSPIDVAPVCEDSKLALANISASKSKVEKVRRPVIGVCGMTTQQQSLIAGEVSEFADLEFWKDDGDSRLRSMAKKCDIIFVNLSQTSHKTTGILKDEKANFVVAKQSGKTAIVEAIKSYFAGGCKA